MLKNVPRSKKIVLTKDSYVPVHQYAKKSKMTKWLVYDYIKKNKFDEGDVRVEKVLQERIRIRLGAKPILKR